MERIYGENSDEDINEIDQREEQLQTVLIRSRSVLGEFQMWDWYNLCTFTGVCCGSFCAISVQVFRNLVRYSALFRRLSVKVGQQFNILLIWCIVLLGVELHRLLLAKYLQQHERFGSCILNHLMNQLTDKIRELCSWYRQWICE